MSARRCAGHGRPAGGGLPEDHRPAAGGRSADRLGAPGRLGHRALGRRRGRPRARTSHRRRVVGAAGGRGRRARRASSRCSARWPRSGPRWCASRCPTAARTATYRELGEDEHELARALVAAIGPGVDRPWCCAATGRPIGGPGPCRPSWPTSWARPRPWAWWPSSPMASSPMHGRCSAERRLDGGWRERLRVPLAGGVLGGGGGDPAAPGIAGRRPGHRGDGRPRGPDRLGETVEGRGPAGSGPRGPEPALRPPDPGAARPSGRRPTHPPAGPDRCPGLPRSADGRRSGGERRGGRGADRLPGPAWLPRPAARQPTPPPGPGHEPARGADLARGGPSHRVGPGSCSSRWARPSSTGPISPSPPTPTSPWPWPQEPPPATSRLVVAPALAYGSSGEHQAFAGTLSIGAEATELVLVELGRSAALDFRAVVVVSTHGGNAGPGEPGHGPSGRRGTSGHRLVAGLGGRPPRRPDRDITDAGHRPRSGPARAGRGRRPAAHRQPAAHPRRPGVRAVSANGVLGDPAGSSAEEGRRLLAGAVDELVEAVAAWPW